MLTPPNEEDFSNLSGCQKSSFDFFSLADTRTAPDDYLAVTTRHDQLLAYVGTPQMSHQSASARNVCGKFPRVFQKSPTSICLVVPNTRLFKDPSA